MEYGVDYIYDYSDLNRLNIRTLLLTGKFKGTILEYSRIEHEIFEDGSNLLEFDKIFYQLPDNKTSMDKETYDELEQYITDVLVEIVNHRRNNKGDVYRLLNANVIDGTRFCMIKIDDRFYNQQQTELNK